MHVPFARCHPRAARLFLGIGLVLIGAAFMVRNLLGAPVPALRFWPLALLLLALTSLVRRGFDHLGGHLLLVAALALQLKDLGQGALLARWWPLALIWLGLVKLVRSLRSPRRRTCADLPGRCA